MFKALNLAPFFRDPKISSDLDRSQRVPDRRLWGGGKLPRLLPVATLMPHFIIQEKFRLPITIEAMVWFAVNLRIPKIELQSKKNNNYKLCINKKDKRRINSNKCLQKDTADDCATNLTRLRFGKRLRLGVVFPQICTTMSCYTGLPALQMLCF